MSPLEQARAEIVADLEQSQGPWRKKSAPLRVLVLSLPALLVVAAAFWMLEPERGLAAPVVVAGVASLLALAATALAPTKPASSERLSQLAAVVAVVAFVAEVARMDEPSSPDWGAGCLRYTAAFTVAAAVVIGAGLRWSRLPLRLWHRIGLSTAATLGACCALWHHCPSAEMLHVAIAHTLGPVALLAVVVVVLGRLQR